MHITHVLNRASLTASAINIINCSLKDGYKVSLITQSIDPKFLNLVSLGLNINILKNPFLSYRGLIELYNLVKEINPSVLHCHHAKSGLLVVIICRFLKIPSLVEIGAQRQNYSLVNRILFNLVQMIANQTVFVSNSVKKSLNFIEKIITKSSNSKVIYYGVDVPSIGTNEQRLFKNKYSLNDGSVIVSHTGRFVPVKRQLEILKIFAEILKIYNGDAKLLIAGDGPLKEELNRETERLKIENSVIFLGMIERTEIYTMLSISDYFIMMSKTEGHSLSLLEAMAYDCIPLLSNIDSFNETISSECAIFIPKEGLSFLEFKKLLKIEKQQSSREFYKSKYSEGIMLDAYYKLYEELVRSQ